MNDKIKAGTKKKVNIPVGINGNQIKQQTQIIANEGVWPQEFIIFIFIFIHNHGTCSHDFQVFLDYVRMLCLVQQEKR